DPFNQRTLFEFEADGYSDRAIISGGTAMTIGSLLLRMASGQAVQAGMFIKSTAAGPVRQTIPLALTPRLIMFLSDMATQSRTGSNHTRAMLGVATPELQWVLAISDNNGVTPTVAKSVTRSGIALLKADNTTQTTEVEGQVQMFRPGAVDIVWSPNDAVALPVGFVAFGDQIVTLPQSRTRLVRPGLSVIGG
ncbi:MAG: hypothetical protein ACREKB_00550, partial [Candidatus Rokuibacteriota bacterium]